MLFSETTTYAGGIIHFIFHDLIIIWGPILLFIAGEHFWHHYSSERYVASIKWTLLEIKVPRTLMKSPLSMELFFMNALYQHQMVGTWEAMVEGTVRFWFSLEIASIDGQVHYFVRTPERLRELVESQLYAHFPQVEIFEVDDYAWKIPELTENGPYNAWGCEWDLDKDDVYPIKTYVDYGLDKDPKDEYRNDPIAGMLEYFGSIRQGEQLWMQIIVRASEKKWHTHGTWFGHHEYPQEVMESLERLLAPYTAVRVEESTGSRNTEVRTPEILRPEVEAIKRAANKLPFDVGIRTLYVATKESWNSNTSRGIRTMFRPYTNVNLNGLKRVRTTVFDYPWQDPSGKNLLRLKNDLLMYYKLRVCFHPPFWLEYPIISALFPARSPKYNVFNTEELATLWHFPAQSTETPTIKRVETKTAKPPANLPM